MAEKEKLLSIVCSVSNKMGIIILFSSIKKFVPLDCFKQIILICDDFQMESIKKWKEEFLSLPEEKNDLYFEKKTLNILFRNFNFKKNPHCFNNKYTLLSDTQ